MCFFFVVFCVLCNVYDAYICIGRYTDPRPLLTAQGSENTCGPWGATFGVLSVSSYLKSSHGRNDIQRAKAQLFFHNLPATRGNRPRRAGIPGVQESKPTAQSRGAPCKRNWLHGGRCIGYRDLYKYFGSRNRSSQFQNLHRGPPHGQRRNHSQHHLQPAWPA